MSNFKIGDLVRLVPVDPERGEERGEVEAIEPGPATRVPREVILVRIFEEYRAEDDADGLVEVTEDQLEKLDAEDLRDWEG